MSARHGRLIGVGTGPGDPELLTLKAVRALGEADVVAHFAKARQHGNARAHRRGASAAGRDRAAAALSGDDRDRQGRTPTTARRSRASTTQSADAVAAHLDAGRTVAVLQRGRSAVLRLLHASACAARARAIRPRSSPASPPCRAAGRQTGMPIVQGDDVLTVLPGTLAEAELARRLADTDAAVIMKVGRNLPKIRRALAAAGKLDRAVYVERGTMANAVDRCGSPTSRTTSAPYFAHGAGAGLGETAVSGRLAVIGLGPGGADAADAGGRATRVAAADATSSATGPISTGLTCAPDQTAHRLRQSRGARARRGGAGDAPPRASTSPSSRAAIPASSPWRRRSARRSRPGRRNGARSTSPIVPGITAMLAVAARIGAPLGHDFCAHLAVRQSEAVGADRARGSTRRRRPASSSRSTIRSARRGPGSSAGRSSCLRGDPARHDAGDLRPRRRPARRDASTVMPLGRGRRRHGRHGDLRHRRLGRDAAHRARRASRRWSTRRASAAGGSAMIEPAQQPPRRSSTGRHVRQRRPRRA